MPKIWLLGRAMRRAPTQKRIKGANSDSILAAIMLITLVIVDELVLLVSSAPYCLSTAGGVQRLPHRDVDSKRPRKQKLLIVRYTTLFVDMGFSRRVSSRFGFYLNASQGSFSFFIKRYGGGRMENLVQHPSYPFLLFLVDASMKTTDILLPSYLI